MHDESEPIDLLLKESVGHDLDKLATQVPDLDQILPLLLKS